MKKEIRKRGKPLFGAWVALARRSPWRLVLALGATLLAAWQCSRLIPHRDYGAGALAGILIGIICAVFFLYIPLPGRKRKR